MNEKDIQIKGERLYEEGKVKVLTNDNHEIRFEVKDDFAPYTEVSFLKKDWEFVCFNDKCSLFRAGLASKKKCYHMVACRTWMINNQKEVFNNEKKKDV